MKNELDINIYALDAYKKDEEANLIFEIKNISNQVVQILKWNTPLEGIISPCLIVKSGNKVIPYDGMMVKRGKPGKEDFMTLEPDQSVSNRIDLSRAYDLKGHENIKVNFDPKAFSYFPDRSLTRALEEAVAATHPLDTYKTFQLSIKPATFKIAGGRTFRQTEGAFHRSQDQKKSRNGLRSKKAASGGLRACTFNGGTAGQQSQAGDAHNNGYALATVALATIANDPTYNMWFGSYSGNRPGTVTGNFQKIVDNMETKSFQYDLTGEGCPSGAYGYTYKDSTTVWFCSAFWTAPDNGTDSKAGTVVHEHSHASAGTDDLAYGQTNCRDLASSDPDSAIKNADNQEYFSGG
ncbi:M35 family metallo-endopeptidase [Pedobacter gandavensis]|uniref:M35 family metallo-endopeptidase n=1 Tax=Pedobacter gandavensis TaxID=2679963 RepID=UPI00292FB3C3|nr:M35 family metallo-endopeptidase [Pedobacter gandavensis]